MSCTLGANSLVDGKAGRVGVLHETKKEPNKKRPVTINGESQHSNYVLTSLFKCSMNTCKLTSSVKIITSAAAPVPPAEAYTLAAETCVVDGLSFDRRKRA